MILLRPIIEKNAYFKPIEDAIYKHIYDSIFKPIYEILLSRPQVENASTTMLINLLREGKLTYEGGLFRGKLNATVSMQLRSIGAKYNKVSKAYGLDFDKIPNEIKTAIAQGSIKNTEKLEKITHFLKAIDQRKITPLSFEKDFAKTLAGLEKQFVDTTKKVLPENLMIPMPKYMQEKLEIEYTQNLDKYVQNWHDEQVIRLHNRIMKNTLAGKRSEELINIIQRENKVTRNKAKFLARQETSLLTAKYRKERYTENGIDWYMWSTSHDIRVRHDHRILNGSYFEFSNPPVTDHNTMARNNPGEDYNCRCQAIPVISEAKEQFLIKQKEGARK